MKKSYFLAYSGIFLAIILYSSCITVVFRERDTAPRKISPLHEAVRDRNLKQVMKLVHDGFSVNIRDSQGNTPLHYCAMNGDKRIAQYLLDNRAAVNARNNQGDTALHIAIRNRNDGVVAVLMNFHADLSIRNNKGQSVRDAARQYGYHKLLGKEGEKAGNYVEY